MPAGKPLSLQALTAAPVHVQFGVSDLGYRGCGVRVRDLGLRVLGVAQLGLL